MPDKEIKRFETLADDGSRWTIIEFQPVTIRRTINGELIAINGPTRWKLTDGSEVNRMENKTYKVLHTGQVFWDVS
jgi:hypothetical protein